MSLELIITLGVASLVVPLLLTLLASCLWDNYEFGWSIFVACLAEVIPFTILVVILFVSNLPLLATFTIVVGVATVTITAYWLDTH